MRVALLSGNARAGDAIGNQVAHKLAFFRARGADIRVFLQADRGLHPSVRPHATIINPSTMTEPDWSFLSAADLIVAEYGLFYELLWLLPALAGSKPRILIDYHGITPPEGWGLHNREALEKGTGRIGLLGCADAVLTHSRFARGELLNHCPLPPERLFCLGLPVDPGWFFPGPPRRPLQDQLGLGQARLLLFVGRVAPQKGVPVLVEALGRLRTQTPAIHAAVIGDTSDLYRSVKDECQRRAAELGVSDRLHFLGHVGDRQLRDAYRSADLFVTPSRHEGFCLPVLEAMACGLPVVAARAGALPETVGDAGLTFAPDDVEDLVNQIRGVLSGGAQGLHTGSFHAGDGRLSPPEQMRRHGLERVAHFTPAKWAEGFGRLIETLLDASPRPYRKEVEVLPRSETRTISRGSRALLVPLTVSNRGTHPAVPEGPARTVLRCRVVDEVGRPVGGTGAETPLDDLLLPGHNAATAVRVPIPSDPGVYQVGFWAESAGPERPPAGDFQPTPSSLPSAWMRLVVGEGQTQESKADPARLQELVQAALAEADRVKLLPDDYVDVTEGRLAAWKSWIKRKILGNFKRAYVDVLSRRQSIFNRRLLTAVHELAEYCASWKQSPQGPETGATTALLEELKTQLTESQRRCTILEARLARLEEKVRDKGPRTRGNL